MVSIDNTHTVRSILNWNGNRESKNTNFINVRLYILFTKLDEEYIYSKEKHYTIQCTRPQNF